MTAAFWIDRDYDRQTASDGVSRYGHYVRDRIPTVFAECWDGTREHAADRLVVFAAAAWRTATGPVMAPGYVRYHPRVLGTRADRSHWDGSLIAEVTLVTPWPAPLGRSRGWQAGQWWRDWPTEYLGEGTRYVNPTEEDVTRAPHLMASAELVFPLPLRNLPAAPSGPRDHVEDTAREAVAALVAELNQMVGPVIDALEGS